MKKRAAAKNLSLHPVKLIPVPLEMLPIDIRLPFAVYLKVADQFILFRSVGDVLNTKRMKALQDKRVGIAYIGEGSWFEYMRALETEALSPAKENESAERQITKLRHLLVAYGQELEKTRSIERAHLGKLEDLGHRLAVAIYREPKLAGKLLRKYDDATLYFVNHSVNVAIYVTAVAQKLGMRLEECKLLTYAALVHNIGNLAVPKEILYKPSKLTREEWEIVVTHPPEGAKLLDSLFAPKEVVLTAMQHHERVDGQGYPDQKMSIEIHLFAKITSIADVFDALTSASPYREALTPAQAVAQMVTMDGKFDPGLLKMLTQIKES